MTRQRAAILVAGMSAALAFFLAIAADSSSADDFAPFDYQKAKALTPEKRRQYDLMFFNEIETWQYNTQRFPGPDTAVKRKAEFERMAADGYLPAYAALRLVGIWPAKERDDREALDILIKQAEAGDVSAMCAVAAIPIRTNWQGRDSVGIRRKFVEEGIEFHHGACLARYGSWLLLGTFPGVPEDRKAAMPLLLDSAGQGYYLAAKRLVGIRYSKALQRNFDFMDHAELERSLCWGRLAQQHTNWAGFDAFLYVLREYARANNRPDLTAESYRLDPKRVPTTEQAVKPEDCIRLEQGE